MIEKKLNFYASQISTFFQDTNATESTDVEYDYGLDYDYLEAISLLDGGVEDYFEATDLISGRSTGEKKPLPPGINIQDFVRPNGSFDITGLFKNYFFYLVNYLRHCRDLNFLMIES